MLVPFLSSSVRKPNTPSMPNWCGRFLLERNRTGFCSFQSLTVGNGTVRLRLSSSVCYISSVRQSVTSPLSVSQLHLLCPSVCYISSVRQSVTFPLSVSHISSVRQSVTSPLSVSQLHLLCPSVSYISSFRQSVTSPLSVSQLHLLCPSVCYISSVRQSVTSPLSVSQWHSSDWPPDFHQTPLDLH